LIPRSRRGRCAESDRRDAPAILFSQTFGAALGDWMADTDHLGYEGGALVFMSSLGSRAQFSFTTEQVARSNWRR
jgi:uncharacterized membrane-anchored protein